MKSLLLFLMGVSCAWGQTTGNAHDPSVVGTWVAEHRSEGGIGSRWVFRADGTLSMSAGAMVDMPYKLEGSTLTLPPGSTRQDAKPQVYKLTFPGNQMCMVAEGLKTPACFTRIGAATPGAASIVGKWKPVQTQQAPANSQDTSLDEKQKEVVRKLSQNVTWLFTSAGTLKLRMPFRTDEGTWNQAAQSFTVNYGSAQKNGKFRLEAGKLVLTQPDGKTEDTYVRDED